MWCQGGEGRPRSQHIVPPVRNAFEEGYGSHDVANDGMVCAVVSAADETGTALGADVVIWAFFKPGFDTFPAMDVAA